MSEKIKEIMSANPTCCTPETSLQDVARMMVEHDCGALPVASDSRSCRPVVGMITDRDIVCRTLAVGKNPLEMRVSDCMSGSVVTVSPEDSIDHAVEVMEKLQVRRLPVADQGGALVGIVTQAHLAQHISESKTGELVKNISKRTGSPSRVSVGAR